MMKIIYKYLINRVGLTRLILPVDSKVVSCGLDYTKAPCIWVERPVERETAQTKMYHIHSFCTGESFDATNLVYVGMIQEDNFIWHVYLEEEE